ncbi:MAG: Fic family protein, partial [Bacteroidota bacterium]
NLTTEKTRAELMEILQISNQSRNYNAYIKPLLDLGIIEMTEPDKPTSSLQRYRLTEKGRKLLKQ